MDEKKLDPHTQRILDRVAAGTVPTVSRIAGRKGQKGVLVFAEDDGVGYVTTNEHGTIARAQPKLKGKRARRQERRVRQQLRQQALKEGREWHCAKWG